MARWDGFEQQAPELAGAVRRQLTATRHCVLGTLRADGSPRLTGLEAQFGHGELWLAMMPDSRKADDLHRDPRFAIHSAPDVSMADGDAKVNGIAVLVDDTANAAIASRRRSPRRHRRAGSRCSAPSSPTHPWLASTTTTW